MLGHICLCCILEDYSELARDDHCMAILLFTCDTGHLAIRDKTFVPLVSVIEFPLYTVNLIPGWKYEWYIISEGVNGSYITGFVFIIHQAFDDTDI